MIGLERRGRPAGVLRTGRHEAILDPPYVRVARPGSPREFEKIRTAVHAWRGNTDTDRNGQRVPLPAVLRPPPCRVSRRRRRVGPGHRRAECPFRTRAVS